LIRVLPHFWWYFLKASYRWALRINFVLHVVETFILLFLINSIWRICYCWASRIKMPLLFVITHHWADRIKSSFRRAVMVNIVKFIVWLDHDLRLRFLLDFLVLCIGRLFINHLLIVLIRLLNFMLDTFLILSLLILLLFPVFILLFADQFLLRILFMLCWTLRD